MFNFGQHRTLLLIFSLSTAIAQQSNDAQDNHSGHQCDCMEYWECISAGGKPYSYCVYSNKVCCFIDQNAKTVGILPRRGKITSCGQKGVDNRKDGFSEPGEWAWHAAILEKPRDLYVCGASLVDEYWVMTAAHCVDDFTDTNSLKVRLGEYDVLRSSEPHRHEEFQVSRVILHPGFDNTTLLHDIALLRLATPAKRRSHINTVCMPDAELSEKILITSKCIVTGWGKRDEKSNHSIVLKEVIVPVWKNNDCERSMKLQFGPNYQLPSSVVCAGTTGRDACDGDGGGPLVCEKNNHWYQIGIVSFGIGCGRPNVPGVYTRVHSYKQWIHDVVLNS